MARDQSAFATTPARTLDGVVVTTLWRPTPAERRELIEGGAILLQVIIGEGGHPPVKLQVDGVVDIDAHRVRHCAG